MILLNNNLAFANLTAEQQKLEAIRLFQDGYTLSEIANTLNATRTNVFIWIRAEEKRNEEHVVLQQRQRRQQQQQQRFILKQRSEAIRLAKEGQSFAEIASALNTNPENVRYWIRAEEKRTGQQIAPRRQQRFILKQRSEAIRLAKEGQSFAEIASALNTNPENVRYWIRAEEKRTGEQIVPRRQQRFTPEQKLEAIELVRKGQTFAKVAKALNISQKNIYKWVRAEEERTGEQIAPRRHATPEQKLEAIELIREGQTFAEVARTMNTSQGSIHKWVRAEEERTGERIVAPRRHATSWQKLKAIELVREGQSFAKVARALNTNPENVRRWIRAEEERTGQQIAPRQHHQHPNPEQRAEAIRLVREGHSFAQAARAINTSPDNVLYWIRAEEERTGEQIAPRQQQQRSTSEQRTEAIQLFREGQNFAEVARALNTNPENVRRWIRAEKERTGQQIVPQQQNFTPEQRAEAIRLVEEGHNAEDVAEQLNISQRDVLRWFQRTLCSFYLL